MKVNRERVLDYVAEATVCLAIIAALLSAWLAFEVAW